MITKTQPRNDQDLNEGNAQGEFKGIANWDSKARSRPKPFETKLQMFEMYLEHRHGPGFMRPLLFKWLLSFFQMLITNAKFKLGMLNFNSKCSNQIRSANFAYTYIWFQFSFNYHKLNFNSEYSTSIRSSQFQLPVLAFLQLPMLNFN